MLSGYSNFWYTVSMKKKKWYVAGFVVLLGTVWYLLLQPSGTIQVPEHTDVIDGVSSPQKTDVSGSTTTSNTTTQKEDNGTSTVLTGTFVGLLPAEDEFEKKYTYLLLDDGTEVLRIDLRPIVGYSDLNIIEKLGVQRGEEIQVLGSIKDGVFTVQTIQ